MYLFKCRLQQQWHCSSFWIVRLYPFQSLIDDWSAPAKSSVVSFSGFVLGQHDHCVPREEALALFSDLNTDMKTSSADCSAGKLLSPDSAPIVKEEPAQPPAKPKKKRIRRQNLELDYLRQLVGKLEEQMTQLKAMTAVVIC